jgi:hypothetical protein
MVKCRHQQEKWYGLAIWLSYTSGEGHLFVSQSGYYLKPYLLAKGKGRGYFLFIFSLKSRHEHEIKAE